MTVPLYWRRKTRIAALGFAVLMGLLIACGGEEATPTQVATAGPASTLSPTATTAPTGAPATATAPAPTPTARPLSTPSPPAASPVPTPGPTLIPQAAELGLEVTSPLGDAVVTSGSVKVAGLTSPDATVSVNGILVTPDSQGRFTIDLPISLQENPMSIEVIATSVAGERRSVVRTVIFIP